MKWLIRGGRVVDPSQELDGLRDVLVEDGLIQDIVLPGAATGWADARDIAADGLVVAPGLIDMHVHLREPGQEYKEDIASGAAAAAAGGFTAVACMPNTKPVCDDRSVVEFILSRAKEAGNCRVWPIAAMTKGLMGEDLCEYSDLAEAGAVGVSDDGRWVANPRVMRRVLEYARVFGLTAISHPEYHELSGGGVMNEGRTATRLGLPGIPAASEEIAVYRDIRLAELTGSPLHLAHLSTAGSVDLVRRAKAAGLPVTAETAPHYFTLTEADVAGYRTEAKMNPPLRTKSDLDAIRAGLADGTIDAIATDHAPHSVLEKELEFDQAAFGVIGLETSLALTLHLVRDGALSLSRAITCMSRNPAGILGMQGGTLRPGQPADLTLIDLNGEWEVDPSRIISKSRNTPYLGRKMIGRAALTMVQGRIALNRL